MEANLPNKKEVVSREPKSNPKTEGLANNENAQKTRSRRRRDPTIPKILQTRGDEKTMKPDLQTLDKIVKDYLLCRSTPLKLMKRIVNFHKQFRKNLKELYEDDDHYISKKDALKEILGE